MAADAPKYVTADIEFRDPSGTKWPNFAYGKPEKAGSFVYDPQTPKVSFSLKLDKGMQLKGEQSNRVLGALISNEQFPPITYTVTGAESFKTITIEKEEKGKMVKKDIEVLPLKSSLTLAGKTVQLKSQATFEYKFDKGKDTPSWLYINIKATGSGKDLGLPTADPIEISIHTTAYVELPAKKK
jgi:hypothetical protein